MRANVATSRRRAWLAVGALMVGFALAHELGTTRAAPWLALGAVVTLATATIRIGEPSRSPLVWARRVTAVVGVVALAMGWWVTRTHTAPRDALSSVVERHAADARTGAAVIGLVGRVLDDPAPAAAPDLTLGAFVFKEPAWRFTLDAESLADDGSRVSGLVRVRVPGPRAPACRAGDRVRLVGMATAPRARRNPGEPDPRIASAHEGHAASLSLSSADLLTPLDDEGAAGRARGAFLRLRATLRARALAVVDRAVPEGTDPAARALTLALLLGQPHAGPGEVADQFTALGLTHVLTISGFHLAVMAAVTLALVRLTGDRGWLEPLLVAVLVSLYTLILPPESPILRSAAMVLVLLAAEAWGRRYDRLTMLGWIGVALLLWRPASAWSLGFQLTLGLTASLFWLGAPVKGALFGHPIAGVIRGAGPLRRLADRAKAPIASSVLCTLMSAPLIMGRTGLVSPLAMVATLVVTPIVVGVLWVGYAAMLAGMIVPATATGAGAVIRALARLAIDAADALASIPGSALRAPPISLAWTIASTSGMAWCLRRPSRMRVIAVLSAIALLAAGEWTWQARRERSLPLRADMLDVGDGTCVLVRSGGGAMLWDCGSLNAGVSPVRIARAVRALGAWRVPAVVVTHPDIDHFGLLPELAGPLGVEVVLVPRRFLDAVGREPTGAAGTLVRALERGGVRVEVLERGSTFALGNARADVLSPPPGATWAADNEHSLVVLLRVVAPGDAGDAGRSLLLTGDASGEAVRALAASHPDLRVDACELPHHGSASEPAVAWVRSLAPRIILQSTGSRRVDDPRWDGVREALPEGGAWMTTATHGASWVEFARDGSIRAGSLRAPTPPASALLDQPARADR